MEAIKASELVLAGDGSLYHIHLTGDTLADNVILVGDPDRVNMFKGIFESVEHESQSRELHALTGRFHGHRFTALSTGMGTDNIDIVMTELDACAIGRSIWFASALKARSMPTSPAAALSPANMPSVSTACSTTTSITKPILRATCNRRSSAICNCPTPWPPPMPWLVAND